MNGSGRAELDRGWKNACKRQKSKRNRGGKWWKGISVFLFEYSNSGRITIGKLWFYGFMVERRFDWKIGQFWIEIFECICPLWWENFGGKGYSWRWKGSYYYSWSVLFVKTGFRKNVLNEYSCDGQFLDNVVRELWRCSIRFDERDVIERGAVRNLKFLDRMKK